MIEVLSFLLILFAIIAAIGAVNVKELISASFLLSCFSFFLAILWTLLQAPDVGFTEAVIGTGASTIFLLLALFGSEHYVKPRKAEPLHLIGIFSILLLGGIFIWGSQELPLLGSLVSAPNEYLSPYYLENAYRHSKTPNVVTAVVVDYRSFDTLIEIAVIFTAGVACLLIMKAKGNTHDTQA